MTLLVAPWPADIDPLATGGICIGRPDECQAPAQQQPAPDLRILFALGSADLTPTARASLADFATLIGADSEDARTVIVEGYTDAVGSDADNLGLSTRRAATVADFLAGRGIARDRIVASGLGEIAEPGDGAGGNPQNRRVDIRLMAP